jgi:hypothetical protein
VARWRFEIWLTDRPKVRVVKHRELACKLCAISRCMKLAEVIAETWHARDETVSWSVSKLANVVDGWQVVYTSQMPKLTRVNRHAHK